MSARGPMSKRKATKKAEPVASHAEDPWLSIKEVATFFDKTHWTIRLWITRGIGRPPQPVVRLKAGRNGGRQMVRRSELDRFHAAINRVKT